MLSRLLSAPSRAALSAGLAGLMASAFCSNASAQWVQRGFDAAGTYANTAETRLTPANIPGLDILWRTQAAWVGARSEAPEAGGLIFDCSFPAQIRARSSATGGLAWQTTFAASNCDVPAIGGGRVFLPLSNPGQQANTSGIVALDQATGTVLWQSSWPSGVIAALHTNSAPALVDDILYIADVTAGVRALDARTGAVKWHAQTPADAQNKGIAVADGRVFVASSKTFGGVTPSALYAFDAATGQSLWSQPEEQCRFIEFGPMVLGDKVITPLCHDGPMTARRASDGQLLWQRTEKNASPAKPLVGHGNTVYSPQYGGLVAIDADTGAVRWRRDARLLTNVAWANGMVFIAVDDNDGETGKVVLQVLDGSTGQRLAKRTRAYPAWDQAVGNSLTVADGRVQLGYYVDRQNGSGKSHSVSYALP